MEHIYDMIIIGSGPAGLSAAVYAARAKLDAVVMEQSYASGGQVITTSEVDNYPGMPGSSGFSLATAFRQHAEQMGAVFERTKVENIQIEEGNPGMKRVLTEKGEYLTRTVILATGARHRKLGVLGEERLSGMGVSYCATCDGAFFRNKTVAVVGGGDVAVEDAIFLSRICEKVCLVHRRDELRAAKALQERLFACGNVELMWNHVVKEIRGEEQVAGILLENVKDGEQKELAVEGVFVAVGITPNAELADGLLERDSAGYIKAGEDGVTSVPGILAAGDVRTKALRQIVTAVSDGANCVTSAERYLIEG